MPAQSSARGEVVAVVALQLAAVDAQQLADHQPQVERLGAQHLRRLREAHVRQHLAVDDVVEVALPLLARDLLGPLAADVLVERLRAHVGGGVVVEDGAEEARLGAAAAALVARDGLQRGVARADAEQAEERQDGHVHLHKGQLDDHLGRGAALRVGDVDVERGGRAQLRLVARADLALQREARGLPHRENVGHVVVQLLLADEHLLAAADDEVAARVEAALVGALAVLRVAARRAHHRGEAAEADLAEEPPLDGRARAADLVHDVHRDGARVGEPAQARHVRHHVALGAVDVDHRRPRDAQVAERDDVLLLRVLAVGGLRDADLRRLLHDVRQQAVHEVVEALDVVAHEAVALVVALQEVPDLVLGRQAVERPAPPAPAAGRPPPPAPAAPPPLALGAAPRAPARRHHPRCTRSAPPAGRAGSIGRGGARGRAYQPARDDGDDARRGRWRAARACSRRRAAACPRAPSARARRPPTPPRASSSRRPSPTTAATASPPSSTRSTARASTSSASRCPRRRPPPCPSPRAPRGRASPPPRRRPPAAAPPAAAPAAAPPPRRRGAPVPRRRRPRRAPRRGPRDRRPARRARRAPPRGGHQHAAPVTARGKGRVPKESDVAPPPPRDAGPGRPRRAPPTRRNGTRSRVHRCRRHWPRHHLFLIGVLYGPFPVCSLDGCIIISS